MDRSKCLTTIQYLKIRKFDFQLVFYIYEVCDYIICNER